MNIDRLRWNHLTPWGRTHVCWAGFVIGGFVLVLIGAALSGQPEGSCSGIAFGCRLSGPDLALLLAIFVGPVVLVALGVGHTVIGLVHAVTRWAEHRQPRHTEIVVPDRHAP